MKILLVVNPISGGVDKKPFIKRAEEICRNYGIDYKIFQTTGNNDQAHLQKVIKKYQPDKVASIGGDGTTMFTGISLMQYNIPMGIVAMGSANGMAVELSVNPDPESAFLDIIMSELFAKLDLVLINNSYYCMHIGDVGVNAQIVNAYSNDPNRGMVTYAKYLYEMVTKATPFLVSVTANDENVSDEYYSIAICNARRYGTGVPLNLEGSPFDGKFELVMVKKMDAASLIRAGLTKFDEKFYDNQNSTIISTDQAFVEFDKPRLLQLDGEVTGYFKKLEIEIVRGAITIITHRGNEYINKNP